MNLFESGSDSLKLSLGGWLVLIGDNGSSAAPEIVSVDFLVKYDKLTVH